MAEKNSTITIMLRAYSTQINIWVVSRVCGMSNGTNTSGMGVRACRGKSVRLDRLWPSELYGILLQAAVSRTVAISFHRIHPSGLGIHCVKVQFLFWKYTLKCRKNMKESVLQLFVLPEKCLTVAIKRYGTSGAFSILCGLTARPHATPNDVGGHRVHHF